MLFNSIEYLFLFLPGIFTIYFVLNKFKLYTLAKIFLLFASLFFYGSYKWDYIYIIICSILFNYYISYLFKKDYTEKKKKIILFSGILGNIIILIFFKYFNSIISIFSDIGISHFDSYKIIMPLGISFFTLQEISYIIDCYKKTVKAYNILDFSLFVCFFPQLIAGPIVRHQEMIPQFNNIKNKIINHENIFIGIFLITIGLLKKTVFADSFTDYIDYINTSEQFENFYIVWLLGITKVLQGYFDYSGYCDIAMGSAVIFNIKLPWNFNSPFKSECIIDFWKRFNMTLMRFLKEYIYKPMEKITKTNINIMIIFITMGIWISTSFASILYGILNGLFVCINRYWKKLNIKMNKYIAKLITFLSVVISTQCIFVTNFDQIIKVYKTMLGINAKYFLPYIDNYNLIFPLVPPHNAKFNLCILILSLIVIFFFKNSMQLAKLYSKSNNYIYTIILVIVFIIATLSITRSSDFIYFIF